MEDNLVERVRAVLDVDPEEFRERAAADAEVVKRELGEGTFDNPQSIVGFEYEFYAVADGRWSEESKADDYALMRVPRRVLDLIGFEKELGLHNAEMSTSPQPLNAHGLRAQEAEVRARLKAALNQTKTEGMRLVSDALWTIPPAGESASGYLTDSVVDDGVRVATNMSDSVRYHAMANGPGGQTFRIEAPHVELEADTVMPESLITSIQPHFQMHQAVDLPLYFDYALRVAGPLLALGVNAPFFPPDLYDDAPPEEILADSWDENRIAVFESVLNGATDSDKVRFPRDLDTVEQAVDRIVADEVLVPMPPDSTGERFDDQFATYRTKHGSYWRWVRPVFDGATRSAANARIEFRPMPAQPTVRDSMAFQAAFAGLLEGLVRHDHPLTDLDWEVARENFYAAVRDGLDAELQWLTNDGRLTTDREELYDDLFAHADAGLRAAGCSEAEAEYHLEPLRFRAEEGITPAAWKRERVRRRLDAGESFRDAVEWMQRAYVEAQTKTLLDGTFRDWF